MEDAAHAGEFRGSCELSAKPRQLSAFLIERLGAKQPSHTRKRQAKHHVTLCKASLDHA